jgi:ankyrin repeat protein
MTPLHRAARVAHPDVVRLILAQRGDPDIATFPSRAPGHATPLAVLAEADMSKMNMEDMVAVTGLLLERMSLAGLQKATTKGQTVFHLAASRGNVEFLRTALPRVTARFGAEASALCVRAPRDARTCFVRL